MSDDPQNLMAELLDLRQQLHRQPELAGGEINTAQIIEEFLTDCQPQELLKGLGCFTTDSQNIENYISNGHGLAAVFTAPDNQPGPVVMLRAELDALALHESKNIPWASENPGCAHKCGHDGHMAILAGLARRLQAKPLTCGSVILLFQPAEETGSGALALLNDPRFTALKPDWIFALHNLPGHPAWSILTRDGAFAAGSAGITIKLNGATSHAAYPEQGVSPDRAMAEIVMALINLGNDADDSLALVTVVHARLGESSFGISPGEAEILATIRSDSDKVLQDLKQQALQLAQATSENYNLKCQVEFCEEFPVTNNNQQAVEIIRQAARSLDLDVDSPDESPFRWSEDFGFLTTWTKGAMFALGAGLEHPVLHGPDFDFNDELLWPGLNIMEAICRQLGLLET